MATPQDDPPASADYTSQDVSSAIGLGLGLPEEAPILGQPLNLAQRRPAASPSTTSSSSRSKHADIELSLPTQRRLIRKPLPDIPPPSTSRHASASSNGKAQPVPHSPRPDTLYDDALAETWWPEEIPTLPKDACTDERASQGTSKDVASLDAASQAHLHSFLFYALETEQGRLPASYHLALFSALLDALQSITDPAVLAGLQRTACIRWRTEAQLRAAAAKNGASARAGGSNLQLASHGTSSSRWARLGWPAAALRGMMHVKGDTPSVSSSTGPAGALEASLAESHHWKVSKEQRVRKRDVALAVLSNAVWLVSTYGSADGTISAAQNATERTPSATQTGHRGSENVSRDTSRDRRLPTRRGGLPNFIPPSAPTTALSASASPSIGPSALAGAERPTSLHLPSSSSLVSVSAPSSAVATPSAAVDALQEGVLHSTSAQQQSQSPLVSVPASRESPAASVNISRPGTPASSSAGMHGSEAVASAPSKPTSKAIEHLSSLNAAVGAAFKAQARAQAEKEGSDATAADSSKPAPSTSRHLSAAEVAETAALEKAEREFIARVGADCEERAKMVLASIMIDLRVDDGTNPNAEQTPSGSVLSTRSDRTIAATSSERDETLTLGRTLPLDADSHWPVKWLPGTFRGENLYAESPRVKRSVQSDEERLKLEGGTFSVLARTQSEGQLLKAALAAALYVACSMRLESELLDDIGYARPQPQSRREASSAEDAVQGNQHQGQESSDSKPLVKSADAAIATQSSSRSNKRWTKGIWGILQSGSDAVHAALHASTSSPGKPSDSVPEEGNDAATTTTATTTTGTGMPRSVTIDGSERKRTTSLNLSRPSTKDAMQASQRRLPTRLGRFIHHLAGGGSADGSAASKTTGRSASVEDEPESNATAPSRASIDVPRHEKTPDHLDHTRLFMGFLSGRSDGDFPPLSTSPELSQALASSYEDAGALKSLRGLPFLHCFMQGQALNVLVGGRNALPSSSHQLGNMGSQGYFNSVTNPGVPPAVLSRSVSGISTAAESTKSELSSTPGTPALPLPPASAPKASADQCPSSVQQQKWTCLNRESVHFYRQSGSGRDIHLGQVIEDVCSRVETIALQNAMRTKQAAESQQASKKTDKRHSHQPLQHPTIHYLHGQYQISIAAQPVGSHRASLETPSSPADLGPSAGQGIPTSGLSAAWSDKGSTVGTAEANEGDVDVLAVAATLSADRDAARTAVALAEDAIQAAESEHPSRPSPHSLIMWAANVHTGQQTTPKVVSDATWLMSFAQFLEAAMYHPGFGQIDAGGADESEDDDQPSRFDIVRFFKKGDILTKIVVKPLTVFELQTEGPVVLSRTARKALEGATPRPPESGSTQDVLETTRLEIQDFYASVKDHIAGLEDVIVQRTLDEYGKTVKPKEGALKEDCSTSENVGGVDEILREQDTSATPEPLTGPLSLLTKLRTSFRENEFTLYEAVKECDQRFVNDIRKVFKDYSRSAQHRLTAWSRKHLTKDELSKHNCLPKLREPAYMGPKQHPFPGSQYVIREDEPLSIIAFSLSSRDFMGELRAAAHSKRQSKGEQGNVDEDAETRPADKMADVLQWRSGVAGSSLSSATSIPSRNDASEEASTGAGSQISTSYQSITSGLSMSHSTPKDRAPDPDKDSWFVDVEPVNVSMKRKKRGRDGSILSLSLRRVGSIPAPSEHGGPTSVGESNSEGDESFEDDFTFSASGLDPNMIDVGGPEVRALNTSKFASTKRANGTSTISSSRTNSTFRAHVTQVSGRPQSLISLFTRDDPSAASLSEISVDDEDDEDDDDDDGSRTASQASSRKGKADAETTPGSIAAATLESQRAQARLGPAPAESPHVKHSLYHGSTKVSCVSWFAAEFAALRRRWGVEEDFVESLAHSRPWQTTGGKSRSNFFKTSDEKWVGKQLLTVWSVDEKDALLEFAPAYIRYMLNADANDCPSLLVKIAGFYSLKIKDVKRGETKLKMSVMILENLFADVKTRATRFDLKGIRDRRAPQGKADRGQGPGGTTPAASTPATPNVGGGGGGGFAHGLDGLGEDEAPAAVYWDAEWIEQYASRAYVPESEQELFVQALRNDLSFLTESNVMDFSLLVGVTEAQRNAQGEQISAPTIRVRIVDYISAFTLAKQLESSSKKVLKSSEARGNVTVLPPSEYAARFEAAMLSYFIGVPERHAGRKKAVNVERHLTVSSVL